MEAAHVGQLGGEAVAVAHQGGEHPAGLDRAELAWSPTRTTLAPAARGGAHEFVEGEGPGQAGLVDDHQLVRSEAPAGHLVFGGGDALAQRRAGAARRWEGIRVRCAVR